jgi:hypothetical protein
MQGMRSCRLRCKLDDDENDNDVDDDNLNKTNQSCH